MKSRLVGVAMDAPYAGITYGFRTTIKETEGTVLGHVALTAATPVAGLIFKANSPKPKRASKTFATGTSSSFIAPAAIAAAIAAGWDIVKAKPNGRKSNSRFQIVVYVTINTVKYAWAMKKSQLKLLGDNLAALGIRKATGNETDLVFGASFPKPPRIKSVTTTGAAGSTTSQSSNTFYDPSQKKIPEEFATYAGLITAADWATVV
jgi:hypothetical protein